MAMRIHDQHGNLITLIHQGRRIIGGDISGVRVHYIGGAPVDNLDQLVSSGLGGDKRHITLKYIPELRKFIEVMSPEKSSHFSESWVATNL